ncbi:MAG: DUF5680 domain-containing protein [Candidatus Dojkabacteria bacterium]
MNSGAKELLGKGLAFGSFSTGTDIHKVTRAGIEIISSDYSNHIGHYNDQFPLARLTAGQEIVHLNNGIKLSRVYAGGSLKDGELAELGITQDDIIKFLIEIITDHYEAIRLENDFTWTKGNLKYEYKVTGKSEIIPVTSSLETIYFNDVPVFQHYIIICPIEG